jgi:serine/threonine protein kinase
MGACLQPPNLFIVMEWSEGGSLFSLLHQSSRAFDLRAIVRRPSLPSSQMRRTV